MTGGGSKGSDPWPRRRFPCHDHLIRDETRFGGADVMHLSREVKWARRTVNAT